MKLSGSERFALHTLTIIEWLLLISAIKMSSSGWSGSNDAPSYPGDSGGHTFTYTTPTITSNSGSYGVSGSASVSTSNGSNGALGGGISGGSVGFTIKFWFAFNPQSIHLFVFGYFSYCVGLYFFQG